MDTLFAHSTAVTMDESLHVYYDCFVGVTDGKISYISPKAPEERPRQIVNGQGMLLMPGLINCHTHLPLSLLRGFGPEGSRKTRLEGVLFPREDKFDGRAVKAAALLSLAECIRFGVTSVSNMYGFGEEIAQAVAQSGIKANLAGNSVLFSPDFDVETHPACQELFALKEKWHGYDHGRILIEAGIGGEYSSDHRLWEAMSEYALNEGLGLQVHLSQTRQENDACDSRHGLTPAQVLDCHNVFLPRATAAHCTWLTPQDMALLAKRKVSAVHCPVSNLKQAEGCADVLAMVKAGMNVALGTNSAAANNTMDLFEEMKAAALMAKAKTGDPGALPPSAAVMMATVCGAKAQGRQSRCGMIKLGMDADLILLDFTAPHLIPCHDVYSQLVYAASGHDVMMTMVQGKMLYAGGKYFTIDLDAVVRELTDHAMPTVFAPDEPVQREE